MKERRVRFTVTASQHVDRERNWWLANRDHQELFATELEGAVQVLAVRPGAGTPYSGTNRDVAIDLGTARSIDPAHAALTKWGDDLIRAESRTGNQV